MFVASATRRCALDMSVEEGMKLVISGGIVDARRNARHGRRRPPPRSAGGEQPHGVMALEQVQQDP